MSHGLHFHRRQAARRIGYFSTANARICRGSAIAIPCLPVARPRAHHGVMKLPTQKLRGLRVRDFMASRIVTFSPEMPISGAVGILVQHRYSGAPVVDAKGRLVGVLSEKDCLRVAVLGTADAA